MFQEPDLQAKDALKIDSDDSLLPVLVFNDKIYRLEDDILSDLERVFSKTDIMKNLTKKKYSSGS